MTAIEGGGSCAGTQTKAEPGADDDGRAHGDPREVTPKAVRQQRRQQAAQHQQTDDNRCAKDPAHIGFFSPLKRHPARPDETAAASSAAPALLRRHFTNHRYSPEQITTIVITSSSAQMILSGMPP